MPRQRLAVGEHGTISLKQQPDGRWSASCYVRDPDGHRRQVRRDGRTKGAANKAIQDALASRPGLGHGGIDRESRLRDVGAQWLARTDSQVATGALQPNTARLYRSVWDNHVQPAVGELRVREATVGRLDDFLIALRARRSSAITKTARAILSGIMGHAARAGAIAQNPVRDLSRIPGGNKREPRALTAAEREDWLDKVTDDVLAQKHDLPDLTRFLLSTGVRIGEALAVTFADVDFAEAVVVVEHSISRIKGVGLVRGPTKTASGRRTLRLTPYTLQMLEDRLRLHGEGPVFPSDVGTWRDPSNTSARFREARTRAGYDFRWLTSHAFRKTAATVMDEGGLTAREIADQIGHSRVSLTQDVYMGRKAVTDRAVTALAAAEVWERKKLSGKYDDGQSP